MQYTKLGNSDLNVSRICLGCMGFGDAATGQHSWTLPEPETREIIKYALDKGINFFDTAIAYQLGSSERFVGKALRDMAKREDVVVATKFLPRTQSQLADGVTGEQAILASLDQSLQNLGMDYIDLYIYHIWDYNTPYEEVMQALHKAKQAGKVREIGIANAYAYQIAKTNAFAEREGLSKFISVQNHYNLIMREDERELFALCHEDNIALTPYSALASGRLSRLPSETSKRAVEDAYAKGKYDATAEQDGVIIARVAELAQKYGVSMTEVSLAWLLTKVDAPIAGATKQSHINGAVNATKLSLCADDLAYLEEAYKPHNLVGIMAQNTAKTKDAKQVWNR